MKSIFVLKFYDRVEYSKIFFRMSNFSRSFNGTNPISLCKVGMYCLEADTIKFS